MLSFSLRQLLLRLLPPSPSSSPQLVASLGIFCSSAALLGLLLFVPIIVHKANNLRAEIEEMSVRFKRSSDRVWHRILSVEQRPPPIAAAYSPPADIHRRRADTVRFPRSPWNKHICQGCHSLTCAMGMPGSNGPPGPDGAPGEMGKQGAPGDDGFDVQLQPEGDLPCVICPAGPPGQRGPQGERGRIGESGYAGGLGPAGKEGVEGPPGKHGAPGAAGARGPPGRAGPRGEQVIAGVGIKGPQGPPGPAGPKGPQGVPGKLSRDAGLPGKLGPAGPEGPKGQAGGRGEQGNFGPPGEPGEPASYCPSDCGVSHIKAPSLIAEHEVKEYGGRFN